MEDFVPMESVFVPIKGHLPRKEDSFPKRFDTILPYSIDEHCMWHTSYKAIEPVDPGHKEIDPSDAGIDPGLQMLPLNGTSNFLEVPTVT